MYGGLNGHRGGSGEPLVLLHGIGSNWQMWKPVLPALEERHDVLALDLPGFGESRALPSVDPSIPVLVDAAERAMDEAGFETAHLGGNSMGGWISLELARRGRARTVTAISPAGMWSPKENAWSQRQLRITRLTSELLSPVVNWVLRPAVVRVLLFPGVFGHPARIPPEDAAYAMRSCGAAPWFDPMRRWMDGRHVAGLDEVSCPVTIAWGTRDRLLLPRQGPRFVRHLPDARLVELEGLGHLPTWDDPGVVSRAILDTTARVSAEAVV